MVKVSRPRLLQMSDLDNQDKTHMTVDQDIDEMRKFASTRRDRDFRLSQFLKILKFLETETSKNVSRDVLCLGSRRLAAHL